MHRPLDIFRSQRLTRYTGCHGDGSVYQTTGDKVKFFAVLDAE